MHASMCVIEGCAYVCVCIYISVGLIEIQEIEIHVS